MLAAQHHDAKHAHWPVGLIDTTFSKDHQQRMSKVLSTSLSTGSEWQVPFPLSEQDVEVNLSASFNPTQDAAAQCVTTSKMEIHPREMDVVVKEEEDVNSNSFPITRTQHSNSEQRDGPNEEASSQFEDREKCESQPQNSRLHFGSFRGAEQSSAEWLAPEASGGPEDHLLSLKDEDDEGMEYDDEGDADISGRPLTAAERSAARRKMKRFRLTHQQTRFLMSEFVKQPHPDAAHRDRLSREIPGLSPRQVQVWFQNRRAKIKRLNAEDRDRVIKMRAVPENFDNIQALHSPYGAVHGLGPNVASSTEMGGHVFGDPLQRPLMVDVQRPDASENLSPTGLTPAFENAGFSSVSVSNADLTSPLSAASHDRFRQYGGTFPPSLASATAPQGLASGTSGRPEHDASRNGHQGMRPLQPLHLRDTLSRPRADSVHSPLRSAHSWKGESIDYPNYHFGGGATAAPVGQQSGYQMGSSTQNNAHTFNAPSYSGDTDQTPSDLSYSGFSASPNQQRSRATSATFPLSLDLRSQYGGLTNRSSGLHSANRPGASTSTQYTSPSIYTTSYPPAPLTAPINIPQPRGSFTPRGSLPEHSEQQMSAPSSATFDFSRRQHTNASQSTHTPMRDSFGGGAFTFGQDDSRTET